MRASADAVATRPFLRCLRSRPRGCGAAVAYGGSVGRVSVGVGLSGRKHTCQAGLGCVRKSEGSRLRHIKQLSNTSPIAPPRQRPRARRSVLSVARSVPPWRPGQCARVLAPNPAACRPSGRRSKHLPAMEKAAFSIDASGVKARPQRVFTKSLLRLARAPSRILSRLPRAGARLVRSPT